MRMRDAGHRQRKRPPYRRRQRQTDCSWRFARVSGATKNACLPFLFWYVI